MSTGAHDRELLETASGYVDSSVRTQGGDDPRLRIAYVAYHFPPLGGAGTQRSLKTVVHLPTFGFEPIVVTGPGHAASRWTPPDETLTAELPADLQVLRVAEPEPPYGTRKWHRWWQKGVMAALRSLDDVDAIYISMSPFSSAKPTARVAAERGIPWIAGLRDPWALDEMMAYPTWLHRSLEKRRMRRVLSSASWIVVNTPEAAKRVKAAFPELADRIAVNTNGYDSGDFAEPPPSGVEGRFRIAHTGYLHTEEVPRTVRKRVRRLLGGEILDVDISTRSHLYLVEALRRIVGAEPRLRAVIEVDLAGVFSPEDPKAAADLEFVRFLGYLPHAESVALIQRADLLFLPMHKIAPGARAGIVPGKTFEYLATGKPILAAVPAGDARDYVQAAGTGLVCDPDDIAAMVGVIRAEITRWESGERPPLADAGYVEQFERKVLTRKLAATVRRVVTQHT